MTFMHALCYFFLSLQLIPTVMIMSFHQTGAGKKDTEKEVVTKLSLFLFVIIIIIYFTKLENIKSIYGKNMEA